MQASIAAPARENLLNSANLVESPGFRRGPLSLRLPVTPARTDDNIMISLYQYRQFTLLLTGMLLCFSMSARADDVQDAEKLYRQKQYDQALQKVDTMLAAKPKDLQVRFLKGNILAAKGKIQDAIGVFQAITEDAPERPEPYNNLGFLYAVQGQYDKARSALEMAIRNQPTYALAHENLGDIYAKLASLEYERALQLDPNNMGMQAKLATVRQLFAKSPARAQTMTIPAATPASAPAAAADPTKR
jgi:tetratricopeptide (TPR) repeat protein